MATTNSMIPMRTRRRLRLERLSHALTLPLLTLAAAVTLSACGRDAKGDAEAKGDDTVGEAAGAPKAGGEATEAERAEVVRLDTAGIRLGGIQIGVADSAMTSGLPVTGTITYDANRVSHIGARTDGRILAVRADLGARVRRGQMLAELESADVGQIRAEEREATALLRIARENYARERRLEQQGISSRKELLEAEAEMRRAEAALRSAADRLSVLGAGHGTGGHFDVSAPFGGTVVTRNASRGAMATTSDTLFTLADLSEVWIELDVFERDLARVRTGQPVVVTVEAYPGRTFRGRVVYLGEILDPAKRTVRTRVELPNPDGALKPGMFARGTIRVGGAGPAVAAVPQDAVQEVEGKQVVFVPGARAGEFRPVPVEIGEPIEGRRVTIRAGLRPGERVVTTGAFALRSELAKGEIGEHGH